MKPSPPLMRRLRILLLRHPRFQPLACHLTAWEVFDYSVWQVLRRRQLYRLIVDILLYVHRGEERRAAAANRHPPARD